MKIQILYILDELIGRVEFHSKMEGVFFCIKDQKVHDTIDYDFPLIFECFSYYTEKLK